MNPFNARARDAYLQTEMQSRTPLELVAMLYDGAIRFTTAARDAAERRDIAARGYAVSRTLAIISELQSTLDLERGGEIAASLDRLYRYVTERLLTASMKKDAAPFDDALKVLTTLREGWATIAQRGAAAAP
ncbi:MAG TPA: flagellar export chaperone FliS [Vicinamibacterales bacterium]|nr:flagellar export chaperone FliS [Vicinamibacterales bacterium]